MNHVCERCRGATGHPTITGYGDGEGVVEHLCEACAAPTHPPRIPGVAEKSPAVASASPDAAEKSPLPECSICRGRHGREVTHACE